MPDRGQEHPATENHLGRTLFLWLATVSVGMVLAFITAEVALRVFGLAPTKGLVTVTESQFNEIPGMFSPDQSFVSRTIPALPYTISIDSRGFRATRNDDQSKGPPNVLYIGDSFTFGDFVDDTASIPARLEQYLSGRCEHARVINAGVGGTTIVDHQHVLSRTLSQETDLVILQFSTNDVEDLLGIPSAWDRFAYNRHRKSRFPLSIVYPTLRNTALWNAGLMAYGAFRERRKLQQIDPLTADRQDSITGALRTQYQRTLYAFRDSVAAHRVPFLLVIYPSHYEVTQGGSEQLKWLEDIARNGNIRSVNLLDPLVGSGLSNTELYLLPHDGHASPRGYEIAADFLTNQVFGDSVHSRPCTPISQP